MAGGTIHWRAFKDTIDMTTCTINCSVLAIEVEGKFRMIHHRRLPAIRRMTGCTQRSKLSIMSIILDMTGDAIHWRTFENAIDVATFAGNSRVPAIEMECEFRMIDIGRLPAGRGMARRAVGSKLTLVRIIIGMTGGAVHGCAFEDAIDMATFAGNRGMFSIKLECEFRMIDIGGFPAG